MPTSAHRHKCFEANVHLFIVVMYISTLDDMSAIANVNYESDGTILANIVTKYDTYVIEVSKSII